MSDVTKFEVEITKDPEKKTLKFRVYSENNDTSALQEVKMSKYGPQWKTHDKITPLLKLIEREDKLTELNPEQKQESSLEKALKKLAEKRTKNGN